MASLRPLLVLVFILQAHFVISALIPKKEKYERQVYEMDTAKLRRFWHTGTIRGVIQAYTKSMLTDLPHVEKVVYDICMGDAKSIVDLAKCSVRVFNTRDALKRSPPITSYTSTTTSTSTTSTTSTTTSVKTFPTSSLSRPNSLSKKWVSKPGSSSKQKEAKAHTSSVWILGEDVPKKRENRTRTKIRTKKKGPILTSATPSSTLRLHPSKKRVDKTRLSIELEKADLSGVSHRDRKRAHFLQVQNGIMRTKRSIRRRGVDGTSEGTHMTPRTDDGDTFSVFHDFSAANATANLSQKQMGNETKQAEPGSYMSKLHLIREHFRRVKECDDFFKDLNERNKQFFEQLNLGFDSDAPIIEKQKISVLDEVIQTINAFEGQSSDKLSFFSPRVLSLLPEAAIPNHAKIMSPTLFSFQKEGILSVPDLFKVAAINKEEQNSLLEMIMDISGAGKALERVFTGLKPEMDEIKNVKYPIVQKLMKHDERWKRSRASFTEEQNKDFDEKGFAFLDEEQLNLIYEPEDQLRYKLNTTMLGRLTKEEKMARLEKDIRAVAAVDRPQGPSWGSARVRRQADDNPIDWVTLAPRAFAVDVLGGSALDIVTLSPRAFIVEVLWPAALIQETLSPRAFFVSVLCPNALIARILSPTAFRVEVLDPRALVAWVLSPQAFLVQILTPNALNPHVLNPDAFLVNVLSPSLISPGVASPIALEVFVLSPSVLSPRVLSDERLIVEVFSPHILGGEHVESEAHQYVSELGGFGGAHSPHYHGGQFVQD
ncbi:unnamed protein product [Cylicocyclus nassatus]|uniref:Uncharacterized protein n=1 Tax=Cylicocyclus nassatus TaxID=53992 RepID=A0AA36HCP9_CYLNA|nr:unnamed protein product [Cylicocyclus nassatus]